MQEWGLGEGVKVSVPAQNSFSVSAIYTKFVVLFIKLIESKHNSCFLKSCFGGYLGLL